MGHSYSNHHKGEIQQLQGMHENTKAGSSMGPRKNNLDMRFIVEERLGPQLSGAHRAQGLGLMSSVSVRVVDKANAI